MLNPTYTYEVVEGADRVTLTGQGATCKLTFNKPGSCTVRVTVLDALGEKQTDKYDPSRKTDYTFDKTYHTDPAPEFSYPATVELGKPARFGIEFVGGKAPADAAYSYRVEESVFDHDDRNVSIVKDDRGGATITFKDYGCYTVTAEVSYLGKKSVFRYRYAEYYHLKKEERDYQIIFESVESPGNRPLPPDLDSLINWYRPVVQLGTKPVPHRFACIIHDAIRSQSWAQPHRVDYRIISDTELCMTIPAGKEPVFRLDAHPYYLSNRKLDDYPEAPVCVYAYPYGGDCPPEYCGPVKD